MGEADLQVYLLSCLEVLEFRGTENLIEEILVGGSRLAPLLGLLLGQLQEALVGALNDHEEGDDQGVIDGVYHLDALLRGATDLYLVEADQLSIERFPSVRIYRLSCSQMRTVRLGQTFVSLVTDVVISPCLSLWSFHKHCLSRKVSRSWVVIMAERWAIS